jgi:hypothetical protein
MPDSDYLLDAAHKHWRNILKTCRLYDKKKPIILLDIQQQRIHIYPLSGSEMRRTTRHSLTEQCEKAVEETNSWFLCETMTRKGSFPIQCPLANRRSGFLGRVCFAASYFPDLRLAFKKTLDYTGGVLGLCKAFMAVMSFPLSLHFSFSHPISHFSSDGISPWWV